MNNKLLIEKLQNIYENQTLGDIPEIIKQLKIPQIKIGLTYEDIDDLRSGETFEWSFEDQNKNIVEVELYNSDFGK